MWKWLTGMTGIVVVIVAATSLRATARRRRRYQEAVRRWQETAPERRRETFESLTDGPDLDAAVWFLLGCAYLQEAKMRLAARAFGVAHHADYKFESAALLTFACLKSTEGPDTNIVEQMIRTWHEMREPDLLRHQEDRLMLECLASTTTAPPLSPLGRLIWLTAPSSQHARVEKILANGDPNGKALQLVI